MQAFHSRANLLCGLHEWSSLLIGSYAASHKYFCNTVSQLKLACNAGPRCTDKSLPRDGRSLSFSSETSFGGKGWVYGLVTASAGSSVRPLLSSPFCHAPSPCAKLQAHHSKKLVKPLWITSFLGYDSTSSSALCSSSKRSARIYCCTSLKSDGYMKKRKNSVLGPVDCI